MRIAVQFVARLLLAMLALFILLMVGANALHAQESAPTPRTLVATAAQLATKTARTKFHTDSLRAEYPPFANGSPCWKFTEPDLVVGHDRTWCHSNATVDGDVDRGNLSTYYRGAWKNYAVSDRTGVLIFTDGTRSRPAAANVTQ